MAAASGGTGETEQMARPEVQVRTARSTRRRPGRRTNLALLGLVTGAVATGVLGYGVGTAGAGLLVAVAHGAFGLGLLLLVPWKSVIVRRGLGRKWRPVPGGSARRPLLAGNGRRPPLAGTALGLLLLLALGTGLFDALAGYRPVLGLTALTVHVVAAVLAVPLLAAHAYGRRQRPRRTDLSRRVLLQAGALGAGSAATYGAVAGAAVLLDLPGGHRRGTGSHEAGSGDPAAMPVTQWFTDGVPALDRDRFVLTVAGRRVPYRELAAGTDEVTAVLDCTGGWYAEQRWRGVRLDRFVGPLPTGTRSVVVVSATGYRRRLPVRDLNRLLLATHAGGERLSDGHGGPVRLVAPGRRGFWWVKWVQRIELSDRPWELQSPFPLQ